MVKLKLNMRLLPMKAHYFLYNAATAPVVPFMPTYAKQLGFSTVVVGTLYTILPISGMIAKPLFGGVADRLKWHKKFFMLFMALTGIVFFGIKFIPETELGPGSDLDCGAETFFKSCGHVKIKCALQRLLAATGNDTAKCTVHCPSVLTSEWDPELCLSWKADQFCATPHSYNGTRVLDFEASVPLNHTVMLDDCLYFRVKTASFEEGPSNTIPYCNTSISTKNCHIICDEPALNATVSSRPVLNEGELLRSANLWIFSILMLVSWIAMAVVVSIGDAICFELLEDKPVKYGKQRVWGSVGWGIFSVLAGYLVDLLSRGQPYKDYDVVFYLTLGIILVDFLVSTQLKVEHTKMSSNIFRDIGKLLSEIRITVFLIWCIAIGMCTGLLWNFLFWHLEDLAGCESFEYIKTLEGLVMGVQCFGGELPFFFISGWVIKKIGHIHAMSLVLLGFGVRFYLYFWLVNPWWVLPIELLNGVTFGIFYATMASYASIIAPPGTEATVQGLVGAIFEGIGISAGSLLGGVLYKSIGGARTFRLFGTGALILFVVHIGVQKLLSWIRRSRGEPELQGEKVALSLKTTQWHQRLVPGQSVRTLPFNLPSNPKTSPGLVLKDFPIDLTLRTRQTPSRTSPMVPLDFPMTARYATPSDAISMLDDDQ